MRKYSIASDLVQVKSLQPVVYKQYDNGDSMEVELFKDGNKIALTNNETVLAFFELPDGTVEERECVINDKGHAVAVLDNIILSQAGKLMVDFTIYKDGNETTTRSILITVEGSINRNKAIETIPQWSIVSRVLDLKASDGVAIEEKINTLNQAVDTKYNELAAAKQVDAEVILARGTEPNLKARLDKFASGLAETETKARRIKEEFTPLFLPTWDGASDALHPSVIYNQSSPFAGFRYWMVNTPLTAGNGYGDRWECPCVFRSHDGITWRVNSAAGNPLDDLTQAEIDKKGYFSDPCLVRVGNTLEVWYRITSDGSNLADTKIVRKVTSDGITWSERQIVFDPLINNGDVGMGWYPRSQQVLYENGKYIMYYTTNTGIERVETTNPLGSVWTNKTTINYDGQLIWHFSMARHSSGKLHIVGYSSNQENVGYWIGETSDINFTLKKTILSRNENISLNADRFYQSAICFVNEEVFVYATMRSKRTGRWRTVLLKGTSYNDLSPVNGALEENRKVHSDNIILANSLKPNGRKDLMYRVYESDDGLQFFGYGHDLETNQPVYHYSNAKLSIPLSIQDGVVSNTTANPISKPNYTGQLFQFLQTKKLYMSFGDNNVNDWIELLTLPKIAIRVLTGDPISLGAIPHYNGQIAVRSDTKEVYLGTGVTNADWIPLVNRPPRTNNSFSNGFTILNTHYKIVFNAGTAGTLTNLVGGYEGQEIIIVNALASDIIIQSNATLIPKGKVDRVLKQFEAIKLTKTSTMWMEI